MKSHGSCKSCQNMLKAVDAGGYSATQVPENRMRAHSDGCKQTITFNIDNLEFTDHRNMHSYI